MIGYAAPVEPTYNASPGRSSSWLGLLLTLLGAILLDREDP
jgi:hypothetical protein